MKAFVSDKFPTYKKWSIKEDLKKALLFMGFEKYKISKAVIFICSNYFIFCNSYYNDILTNTKHTFLLGKQTTENQERKLLQKAQSNFNQILS